MPGPGRPGHHDAGQVAVFVPGRNDTVADIRQVPRGIEDLLQHRVEVRTPVMAVTGFAQARSAFGCGIGPPSGVVVPGPAGAEHTPIAKRS